MPSIISIVGKSDSGKTTLLEKLIEEFCRRGHRVGTIKHDTHGFDIDHEGKDSWRHKKAGAATVIISSPTNRNAHSLGLYPATLSLKQTPPTPPNTAICTPIDSNKNKIVSNTNNEIIRHKDTKTRRILSVFVP